MPHVVTSDVDYKYQECVAVIADAFREANIPSY